MDMLDNLLTVPEVASKLKVTPQYVRRLISESKLMALEANGLLRRVTLAPILESMMFL